MDFRELLRGILEGVSRAGVRFDVDVIFLAHPRTLKWLREFEMRDWADALPRIRIHEAMGYLDFLNLLTHSQLVFTDSGGVQQEACIHQVPAVTLRENPEWVETLENGANRLAGTDPVRIVNAADEAFHADRNWPVPFGSGDTAKQIAEICQEILEE